jgi:hypothetical protein
MDGFDVFWQRKSRRVTAVLVGFVQVRYGQSWSGGFGKVWCGRLCSGWAWRGGLGELRRGWLRLGGAGYGGRGTVWSGSVRRGEVGSVKAGRGGHGVESLL